MYTRGTLHQPRRETMPDMLQGLTQYAPKLRRGLALLILLGSQVLEAQHDQLGEDRAADCPLCQFSSQSAALVQAALPPILIAHSPVAAPVARAACGNATFIHLARGPPAVA
ncbi:hypothetical protein [Parahaliea mediterranea]|uniref:DUF2946 domain-containing protein n=1 Tax=Parahaliea mediterranea TaxID=651086 RepID=A0A939DBV0_9GAMM|nr:hypothetical protein [Parahaliea mediterranea]MBN7795305.1 hypothetical protein [Parahaliea mediterranea]